MKGGKIMQEIIVKNYQKEAGQIQGEETNTYNVKPIANGKCNVNFVEVEPGNTAYGYHWHEENEEVFYIISGEAVVKTIDGDVKLRQGDAIYFPSNEKGSHVISNPSKTEKLVYIDFGTANLPDVVHFTGTNAGMVISKTGIHNLEF